MPDLPTITTQRIEILDPDSATAALEQAGTYRREYSQLVRHVESLNYQSIAGSAFGVRHIAESSREILPPSDAAPGPGVQAVTFEILAQSYESDTQDKAGVATVTVSAGDYFQSYNVALVAPSGDFQSVQELAVVEGQIAEVDGWWERFSGCIGGVGGACLSSLLSCDKSNWAGYLACLALQCGASLAKCLGCATCNCSWWCRWAVGCCEG